MTNKERSFQIKLPFTPTYISPSLLSFLLKYTAHKKKKIASNSQLIEKINEIERRGADKERKCANNEVKLSFNYSGQ